LKQVHGAPGPALPEGKRGEERESDSDQGPTEVTKTPTIQRDRQRRKNGRRQRRKKRKDRTKTSQGKKRPSEKTLIDRDGKPPHLSSISENL
jgi:hypothetical protein